MLLLYLLLHLIQILSEVKDICIEAIPDVQIEITEIGLYLLLYNILRLRTLTYALQLEESLFEILEFLTNYIT